MKIQISLTVEIDPEAWASFYGIEKHDVRQDFKRWAVQKILEHPEGLVSPAPKNASTD
ncbi:hypothetical protein ACT3TP_14925 [Glutamicibacter sp. AOP38-B1-38]|uniref:hypothetical protein n=1 Tax=Glutamicibacter sp. AOP38-B1-38 TaxID=3457680 RepID=UPI00403446C8